MTLFSKRCHNADTCTSPVRGSALSNALPFANNPVQYQNATAFHARLRSQAGGFSLEDPGLEPLVDNIEGSVDSIFGLPVDLLCTLIERTMIGAG